MKTHEEAVKEFEHNIKALKERGCIILSYSWFDDIHYHINFETPEDTKRRKEWEKKIPDVYEILKQGSIIAKQAAAETLHDVRKAMKINYFE